MSGNAAGDVENEKHSMRLWLILALAAAGGLAVLVVLGMERAAARRAEEERKALDRARVSVPTVRVAKVRRLERLLDRVELTGTLRASRDVIVLPEAVGKLERVAARRGQKVRSGDVLAVVESDTLRAQLQRVQAALSVAVSGARAAKVAHENAASDRERLRKLEKTGSASEREVEAAETMLKTAEAQQALADSQVEQARAAVTLAELQLRKAEVTAPFAGVVADDFNRTVGAMAAPQTPIARIVEMQNLRIDLRANERDLGRIRNGQKAEIRTVVEAKNAARLDRVASPPKRVFEGEVEVAGPAVNPATRTALVEVSVENVVEDGEYLLKPGMFAEVSVTVGERKNVLAVRPVALTRIGGEPSVLVLGEPSGEDGRTARVEGRPVKVGLKTAEWVQITAGITAEDMVVVSGVRALAPGVEVRAQVESEAEPEPRR